jgi:Dolichyl-phosphate-mannose-protein mannosyltransferase
MKDQYRNLMALIASVKKNIVALVTRFRRFGIIVLIPILSVEFMNLCSEAIHKPFWYDELITLHISHLQPFARVWAALQVGADSMSPGYYILVRVANAVASSQQLALRLPSLFGYLLCLLGAYCFVRKRLSVAAALMAVLLITLSPFRGYAVEARSYSLLVGFLSVAAVCWQRIGENRFMVPLFGFFLALAVASHHLAVVTIYCFIVAELTWTAVEGRGHIRWSVWIACLVATFPFFTSLPLLLHYRTVFGQHFWEKPNLSTVVSTYKDYLGLDSKVSFIITFFFVVVIGDSLLRMRQQPEGTSRTRGFSLPELSLVSCFLFYPALLVVLTKLFGSGYTPRYGWPGILGLVLGSVYLVETTRLKSSSSYFLLALLMTFIVRDTRVPYKVGPVNEGWTAALAEVSRSEPNLPIVIGSPHAYLEAAEYAPLEIRDRLVGLVDPDSAIRIVSTDTVDITDRLLAQFIPLRFEDLRVFEATHQRFILRSGGAWDWSTEYLMERGYNLNLLSQSVVNPVYIVERAGEVLRLESRVGTARSP